MRHTPTIADKNWCIYPSKYQNNANMLMGKIPPDKAADKCLPMIGQLWSERMKRRKLAIVFAQTDSACYI